MVLGGGAGGFHGADTEELDGFGGDLAARASLLEELVEAIEAFWRSIQGGCWSGPDADVFSEAVEAWKEKARDAVTALHDAARAIADEAAAQEGASAPDDAGATGGTGGTGGAAGTPDGAGAGSTGSAPLHAWGFDRIPGEERGIRDAASTPNMMMDPGFWDRHDGDEGPGGFVSPFPPGIGEPALTPEQEAERRREFSRLLLH